MYIKGESPMIAKSLAQDWSIVPPVLYNTVQLGWINDVWIKPDGEVYGHTSGMLNLFINDALLMSGQYALSRVTTINWIGG